MDAHELLRDLLSVGLTQATVAKETGIPQPTLSRLARGQSKDMPSRRTRKLQALWELRVADRIEQRSKLVSVTLHAAPQATAEA